MKELTLLNFSDVYPDEASCVEALRRRGAWPWL